MFEGFLGGTYPLIKGGEVIGILDVEGLLEVLLDLGHTRRDGPEFWLLGFHSLPEWRVQLQGAAGIGGDIAGGVAVILVEPFGLGREAVDGLWSRSGSTITSFAFLFKEHVKGPTVFGVGRSFAIVLLEVC